MPIPLTSGSTIVTVPTAPSTHVVVPPQSTQIVTSPGRQGPPGAGVNLAGAVPTYADLPDDLDGSDVGKAYVVNSNGKLYVWDGTTFPIEANGSEFKGDTGAAGRGVDDITLEGTDVVRFHMSDASNEDLTVPAITAAAASASAAASSASAASGSATSASGSATAASGSATSASGSASSASTSATNAASSATTATTQASGASSSASAASTSASGAATSASAASTSASGASASATSAAGSATSAGTARDAAIAAQGAAETAEDSAAISASDAAASAAASEASAIEAADVVSSGLPNATDVVKGGVLLPGGVAGELGGTYDHPVVTGWSDKADLVSGKVPTSQIPAIALVTPQVVASTAARIALTAEVGDVAIQTGNPGRGTYMLQTAPASTDGNWTLMVSPTDAVTSVNGYSGIVVLAKADVGLSSVDNTSDTGKPVSTAQQTALNLKADNARTISAGTGLTGGGDLSANRTLAVAYGTASGTAAEGNDSRITGATPTSRTITAGTGLTGGGTLAADRTLTVAYGTSSTTAAVGNDSRLSDARTPSANTVPCDFVYVCTSPGTARAVGAGDWTVGMYVGRAFTLTKVVYQFETADASGTTSCEVRRNGSQVSSSNLTTLSVANQADGTSTDAARTATPNQSFAVGDRLLVQITAIGTTPGKGLKAYLLGTWN